MEFLIFAIGLVLGSLVTKFITGFNNVGSLIISNATEPDESPYIFLELTNSSVEKLSSMSFVTLHVNSKLYGPRK